MKKLFLLCAALAFAGVSQAQDVARVISSTPILQQAGASRPVGYSVVYEFGGKHYTVELPNDPGPTLLLQITPVNAGAPSQAAPVVTYVQPVAEPPVYVVPAPTVSPGYYEPNYFWPFAFGLGFGLLGGFHGDHGGHWNGHGR